jgi:hypothetical protein
VDHLASNGRKHHRWLQPLFWAVTEGAVATTILSAGGKNALESVQAASIVCGLPFVFLLLFVMQSIQAFCEQAAVSDDVQEYKPSAQNEFSFPVYGGVFNACEWLVSLGTVHPMRVEKGMDKPTIFHFVEFVKGLCIPSFSLGQVLSVVYPRNAKKNAVFVAVYTVLFYGWIAIFAASGKYPGLSGPGWAMFLSSALMLMTVRMIFRAKFNLRSHAFGDFVSSLFLWPQVIAQMRQHCVELGLPNDMSDEDADVQEGEEVVP